MNLQTLLDLHRPNHSEFQMNYFITGKTGLTSYGRFKQAMREFESRRQAYINLMFDIITHRKSVMEDTSDAFTLYRAWHKFECLQKNATDALRELTVFYLQAIYYYEASGVTQDNIEALEKDLVVTQVNFQAGMDLIVYKQPTGATLGAVMGLPMSNRAAILDSITKDPQSLIDNVLYWPDPYCPKNITREQIEAVRELVSYTGPGKELLEWSQA